MHISTVMKILGENYSRSYTNYNKNKVKKAVKSGAEADDVYKPIWFAYEIFFYLMTRLNVKKHFW